MVERYRPQTKSSRSHLFPKGKQPEGGGRKKGMVNKIPALIKDAIVMAGQQLGYPEPIYAPKLKAGEPIIKDGKPILTTTIVGYKGTGVDGLVGYVKWLGLNYPPAYAGLLAKVLPLQVHTTATVEHSVTSRFSNLDTSKMSLAELNAAFREVVALSKPLPSKPKLVEYQSQSASSMSEVGPVIEGELGKEQAA